MLRLARLVIDHGCRSLGLLSATTCRGRPRTSGRPGMPPRGQRGCWIGRLVRIGSRPRPRRRWSARSCICGGSSGWARSGSLIGRSGRLAAGDHDGLTGGLRSRRLDTETLLASSCRRYVTCSTRDLLNAMPNCPADHLDVAAMASRRLASAHTCGATTATAARTSLSTSPRCARPPVLSGCSTWSRPAPRAPRAWLTDHFSDLTVHVTSSAGR